jgi:hypothetical protein
MQRLPRKKKIFALYFILKSSGLSGKIRANILI